MFIIYLLFCYLKYSICLYEPTYVLISCLHISFIRSLLNSHWSLRGKMSPLLQPLLNVVVAVIHFHVFILYYFNNFLYATFSAFINIWSLMSPFLLFLFGKSVSFLLLIHVLLCFKCTLISHSFHPLSKFKYRDLFKLKKKKNLRQ